MYSFIQFFTVLSFYWYSANMCDMQFLCQDLFSVFPIGVVMSRTHAARNITRKRPSGNLMSAANLTSVITHFVTNGLLQWAVFSAARWRYLSPNYNHPPNPDNICLIPEGTALQYTGMFMFAYYAIIFSLSGTARHWKRPIFTNSWFMGALFISAFTSFIFLWFGPSSKWYLFASMEDFPIDEPLKNCPPQYPSQGLFVPPGTMPRVTSF